MSHLPRKALWDIILVQPAISGLIAFLEIYQNVAKCHIFRAWEIFREFPVFSGGGNCNMIASRGEQQKFPVEWKISGGTDQGLHMSKSAGDVHCE